MASTLREIALRAEVSPATVSLVLNARPGVGLETRQRVERAATDLGYQAKAPKAKAREGGAKTLRFLYLAKHGLVVNPDHRLFLADYLSGIEAEVRARAWSLEVATYQGFDLGSLRAALGRGGLDGALVLGTELDEGDLAGLAALPLPLVFLDTWPEGLEVDAVDMDNPGAVRAVVEAMVAQGHRRLGLVRARVETPNFRQREAAFRQALGQRRLSLRDEDIFTISSTIEEGRRDFRRLLEGRRDVPTALFGLNDLLASSALASLGAAGLRVPEEISVVGFDDLPSDSLLSPPLASVRVSTRTIGRRAVELLARRMEDPTGPSEKILIGGSLALRESLGPAPGQRQE